MDDQGANRAGGGVRFRTLRIAWSVTWGLLAVLLVVQWLRSYRMSEILYRLDPGNQVTTIGSNNGTVYFARTIIPPLRFGPPQPPRVPHGWKYLTDEVQDNDHTSFEWASNPSLSILYIPFWFIVVTSAALATLPWFRRRFSLRTLLIATTVVAVGMALIIYFTKK